MYFVYRPDKARQARAAQSSLGSMAADYEDNAVDSLTAESRLREAIAAENELTMKGMLASVAALAVVAGLVIAGLNFR